MKKENCLRFFPTEKLLRYKKYNNARYELEPMTTRATTTTEENNDGDDERTRKKIATYLSQHVQQSSPLPKDNSQRKLQSKLDALLLKLRREENKEDGKFVVETLTETALTLQEQAEQYSNALNSNSEEEEENRNICEGLHVKACKAYEFASKWKEECACVLSRSVSRFLSVHDWFL